MKNICFSCFLITLLLKGSINAQNVGISTTGAAPNASAMLDIVSSNKGLLIPRVSLTSTADATTITSGNVTSLLVYNTNVGMTGGGVGYWYWNGTAWVQLSTGGGGGWSLTGNAGTTVGTNFLGTTDAQPFMIKVNNEKSGYIDWAALKANTSFGYKSLNGNTTGSLNSVFGFQALFSNTIGGSNVSNGAYSLYSNIDGSYNIGIGLNALYNNSSGSTNTGIGLQALFNNTTGNNNVAIGGSALGGSTIGSFNVAVGTSCIGGSGIYSYNTGIGSYALSVNSSGNYNCAMGYNTLAKNTSGSSNVAGGSQALFENTTGSNNVATGYQALNKNTNGSYNTAIGNTALYNNISGVGNTGVGESSLGANTTGFANAGFGSGALVANTVGNFNVGIGNGALGGNTTASNNTSLGFNAMNLVTSGSNNTGIGNSANVSVGTLANATAIGNNATVNASNKVRIGNAAVTVIEGQVAYTFPSDARFKENVQEDIPGLEFILKLHPVSYNFNRLTFAKHIKENTQGREADLNELSKNRSVGFLAQDIEQVLKDMNFKSFDGIHRPTNETDNYSLSYSHFVIPLVKAVQELSDGNETLKSQIKKLQSENEMILKKLDEIIKQKK